MPIVSVNPEADPPQPRAPVRPNRAEQDGETAEEKRKGIGIAAERGGEKSSTRSEASPAHGNWRQERQGKMEMRGQINVHGELVPSVCNPFCSQSMI